MQEPLLQRPQVVDHEHPLQVVVLMLDGTGEQAFGLELEPLTRLVLRPYSHLIPPLDVFSGPGKAEATLVEDDLPLDRQDLRIHEDAEIAGLALGRAVHDEDLPELAHLS